MHITFGWSYDGARWAESSSPSTVGRVTAGPATLVDILTTRFALTRPEADRSQRILAYRSALVTAVESMVGGDTQWPVASTRNDPWAVAESLLTWRDELIEGGWDPSATALEDTDSIPERLGVLVRIEALLPDQPGWVPGTADALREVDAVITELAVAGTAWPTGIASIEIDGVREDLPPIWRRIFSGLEKLGVRISELAAPAPLTDLVVRTADSDWDAAPATARMLHDLRGAQRTHTVLSTQSTGLLDRELIRIGDAPVGVRSRHTSPLGEIIPVFLRAMTAPHDVHAIVDLLNVKIPHQVPREKDDPATYRTTMTPIVPKPLHRELSEALNTQPGVGGSAWEKATEAALENTGDRPGDAEHIQEFDRLIRTSPLRDHVDDDELGAGFDSAEIDAHLEWLRLQFTRYIRDDSDISHVTGQIDRIVDLVSALGARVSAKELDQIISAVTGTGGLDTDAELSPDRDVVTNPGQLGRGTAPVVWWLPVDDSSVIHERLRPAEITWLTEVGVDLPAREVTARLTLDSQLRALRRRGRVTVILPERINGEAATEHPTLAFLRHDLQSQDRSIDTGAAALPETRSVVPETMPLAQPDPTYREFTPDNSLLPSGASFSQWEKLLLHPLEWLLGRRLGIEGGSLADVPTGNRMIGTWLHAVVEQIVNNQLDENDGAPVTAHATPDEVTERLVATAPHYASELLLDGRQREYGATLAIARQSITGLFTALTDAGIRVTAVEAKIDAGVTGCHGAEGPETELPLRGFRDMDVIMADGTPGVIDLKYTLAKKKYRELIESGTALQLAVYAKSVAAEHALETLAEVPVAYFSLHDNRLDTADSRFLDTGGPTHGDVLQVNASDNGGADADELWQRAVAGLNTVINDLREGRVVDLGNLVNNPDWQRFENPKKGEDPASPYDEETTDAFQRDLEWMRTTGFFPEDNAKYTEFSLITGASGDFA